MIRLTLITAALATVAGLSYGREIGAALTTVVASSDAREELSVAALAATPLHQAALFGDTDLVLKLLADGADPNGTDGYGWVPLNWAAAFGTPEMIAVLLQAGARVDVSDANGWTPLHWAAGLGTPDNIRALVAAGAPLDAQELRLGWDPLHEAAGSGTPENVIALLEAGADPAAENLFGFRAFDLALDNDRMAGSEALSRLRVTD